MYLKYCGLLFCLIITIVYTSGIPLKDDASATKNVDFDDALDIANTGDISKRSVEADDDDDYDVERQKRSDDLNKIEKMLNELQSNKKEDTVDVDDDAEHDDDKRESRGAESDDDDDVDDDDDMNRQRETRGTDDEDDDKSEVEKEKRDTDDDDADATADDDDDIANRNKRELDDDDFDAADDDDDDDIYSRNKRDVHADDDDDFDAKDDDDDVHVSRVLRGASDDVDDADDDDDLDNDNFGPEKRDVGAESDENDVNENMNSNGKTHSRKRRDLREVNAENDVTANAKNKHIISKRDKKPVKKPAKPKGSMACKSRRALEGMELSLTYFIKLSQFYPCDKIQVIQSISPAVRVKNAIIIFWLVVSVKRDIFCCSIIMHCLPFKCFVINHLGLSASLLYSSNHVLFYNKVTMHSKLISIS
jgi:hypothetical protein